MLIIKSKNMAFIFTLKSPVLVPILSTSILLLFCFPCTVLSGKLKTTTFNVPSGGPESFIFAPTRPFFFTGVNDGRVVLYNGARSSTGYVDFAYASPTRTKKLCDGTTDPSLGNICGRTLGLGYHYKTEQLYLADAYHGLCVVGPKGGLATQLLSSAGGKPLKWLDGIDVDQTTGNVYFTDVSTKYNLSQVQEHLSTGDSTGRLIEYNVKTKKARVLLSGLKGAGGAGVSKDGSFVLVSEFTGNRITKYWLRGPKAGKAELMMNITGPCNLKRTPKGDFWVAINLKDKGTDVPGGARIDENASSIVEKVIFKDKPLLGNSITEVHEHGGALYVASIYMDFGGVVSTVKGTALKEDRLH